MFLSIISSYIATFLLYFFKLKSNVYYKLLIVIFVLPVFFMDPLSEVHKSYYIDINRMYKEIDIFRAGGWDAYDEYDAFIFSKIYLMFFSLFDNNHLLPIINCLIVYLFILYTINNLGKYFCCSENVKRVAILYISIMAYYLFITTNIRQPLAFAICFFVLSYDLIKQKHRKICFLGYCMLSLLHPSIAILVLLRIIIKFPFKILIIFIGLISWFLIQFMDEWIQFLLDSNIGFIQGLGAKQYAYLNYIFISNYTLFFKISCIIVDCLAIISSFLLNKYMIKELSKRYGMLLKLNVILGFLGILTVITDSQMMHRVEPLIIYISAIYIYFINKKQFFYINKNKYKKLVFCFIIIYFISSIYFLYFNIYTNFLAFG